jgi:beta-glucosidase
MAWRAGIATVFPQVIGLASTWNPDLIYRMAKVISDEGRAKHHEAVRNNQRDLYTG